MQSRLKHFNNPIVIGCAAMFFIVAICIAAAVLYLAPPGQRIVFYTDDSASIRVGDSVRIAGIQVGKVDKISIGRDQVEVESVIGNDVFIGNRSQVDVRMLTVVGGYYVNIVSLGDGPLREPIAREQVRMPYSLVQTLTDATKITQNVDEKPIRDSVDRLQSGLTGTRLESLTAVIDAGNSLVSTIQRQRGQVSSILHMSAEYTQALNAYRDELTAMIGKAAILEQTLTMYSKGFADALLGLGDIGQRLKPVGEFYMQYRDQVLNVVTRLQSASAIVAEQVQPIVDRLHSLREWMQVEVAKSGSSAQPQLLATDLCIPLPVRAC